MPALHRAVALGFFVAHPAVGLLDNNAEAPLGLRGGQGHRSPLVLVETNQRVQVDIADAVAR